jgi:hypothetical protein
MFPVIHTTPNILTEVDNLGKKLGNGFHAILGRVVTVLNEHYCESKTATA